MPTTVSPDLVTRKEAEQQRLRDLSGQSIREDTVIVEVLYLDQWVRFDLSAMEAQYLSAADLVVRYLAPALQAVKLPRAAADADPSSSSTPSL